MSIMVFILDMCVNWLLLLNTWTKINATLISFFQCTVEWAGMAVEKNHSITYVCWSGPWWSCIFISFFPRWGNGPRKKDLGWFNKLNERKLEKVQTLLGERLGKAFIGQLRALSYSSNPQMHTCVALVSTTLWLVTLLLLFNLTFIAYSHVNIVICIIMKVSV